MSSSKIEVITRLDGIILAAKSFHAVYCEILCDFELNTNFIVHRVYPSTFKGIRLNFEDFDNYKLLLGTLGDDNWTFWFIFSIRKTEHAVDFITLKQKITEIAQEIVNSDSQYADLRFELNRFNQKGKCRVKTKDFQSFASSLVFGVQRHLNSNVGKVKNWNLIFTNLGQNAPFENLKSGQLRLFNLAHCTKIVIHHATDFSVPGHVGMWSMSALLQFFEKKRFTKSYHVGLIKGCGNVYVKEDKEEKELHSDETANLFESKFYTEMFKYMHKYKNHGTKFCIFGLPKFAEELFCPREFGDGFLSRYKVNWNRRLNDVLRVKSYVESLKNSTKYARFERILWLDWPKSPESVYSEVTKYCQSRATRMFKCIEFVPSKNIFDHLTVNLMPFVEYLESKVVSRMNCLTTVKFDEFGPGDFFKVFAAESIICFTMYGNVCHRKGRRMYPPWIIRALRLGRYDFSKEDGFKFCNWMFPMIDQSNLDFQPLNFSISESIKMCLEENEFTTNLIQNVQVVENMITELDNGSFETDAESCVFDVLADFLLESFLTCLANNSEERKHKYTKRVMAKLQYKSEKCEKLLLTAFEFSVDLFSERKLKSETNNY